MNNPTSKITQTRTKAKNKSSSPITMGTDAYRRAMEEKQIAAYGQSARYQRTERLRCVDMTESARYERTERLQAA